MNEFTDKEILFLVAQVMTSGIKQEGAQFTLPESMIIELVQRAMAMEREACARVCDQIMQFYKTNTTLNTEQNLIGYMAAEVCGVRIRERGQK